MFYDKLNALCKEKGTNVSAVARELGFSSSNVTAWKNGRMPKVDKLIQISKYLGVETNYFFDQKEKATEPLPDDLASQRIAFFGDPGQTIDKDELAQLVLLKERMKAIKKIDSILEGLTDEQVIHFAQKLEELHNQK